MILTDTDKKHMLLAADRWREANHQMRLAEAGMGLCEPPWNEELYDYETVYPTWERHNEDLVRLEAIGDVVGHDHPALNTIRWELTDVTRWLEKQGEVRV